MLRLRQRERRVVFVGVVITAAGLLFGRMLPAWSAWVGAERSDAERLSSDLQRTRARIQNLSVARDTLMARNGRYLALAPSITPGRTAGAAGASLASLVSGMAATAGLRMGALQIRSDTSGTRSEMSVFRTIAVRGDAQGDVRGVARFLAAIEGSATALAIRHLSISQPEPAAPPDRPEGLRIEFVIEGLALHRNAARDENGHGPSEPASTRRSTGQSQ
jgi:hypothetical protein